MKIKTLLVAFALMFTASFQAQAADALSNDAIKALITGKTVNAEHAKKGFSFKVYFAADGSATRDWKGDMQEGKWFFKDGLHCINVGSGDKCASIVPNGDGTYKRLKGGKKNKHFINWLSIVDGKHL